jgi:hypothetical protein
LDSLGFIRPNRDLSMGYSEFQIRIFPLAPRLAAKRASPGAPSFSDDCDDVGRIPIFARLGSKKLWPILNPAWSSGRRFGLSPHGASNREQAIPPANPGTLRALTGRERLHALPKTEPTAIAIRAKKKLRGDASFRDIVTQRLANRFSLRHHILCRCSCGRVGPAA